MADKPVANSFIPVWIIPVLGIIIVTVVSMVCYLLYYDKPKTAELIVDEALSIASEIATWKEKKASEEANSRYNEILNYGFDTEEQSNG